MLYFVVFSYLKNILINSTRIWWEPESMSRIIVYKIKTESLHILCLFSFTMCCTLLHGVRFNGRCCLQPMHHSTQSKNPKGLLSSLPFILDSHPFTLCISYRPVTPHPHTPSPLLSLLSFWWHRVTRRQQALLRNIIEFLLTMACHH